MAFFVVAHAAIVPPLIRSSCSTVLCFGIRPMVVARRLRLARRFALPGLVGGGFEE